METMTITRAHVSTPIALRVVAILLAVAAAWGPRVGGADDALRVVLLDVSPSVSRSVAPTSVAPTSVAPTGVTPSGVTAPTESIAALIARRTDGAAVHLIAFAGDATLLTNAGGPLVPRAVDAELIAAARRAGVAQHASDLAAGLRLAATLPREGRELEILVVSDGRFTGAPDDLTAAALALRQGGGAVIEFGEVATRVLAPRVASLTGPGRVRRDQVFSIVADGDSGPAGGRLQLLHSGHVVHVRSLPPGPFRVRFPMRFGDDDARERRASYRVRFEGQTERPAPRSNVLMDDPRSALVIVPNTASTPGASVWEAALGSAVTLVDGRETDWERLLATHDLVVVAGAAPPPRVRSVLSEWIVGGGGALLVGDVRFDALSPLHSVPPDDPGVFLYVAVDGSGSMGESWSGSDGRSRDVVVRTALRELVADVADDTTVALRRFNDRLLPGGARPWLGRPGDGDREDFDRALERLPPPAGGTLLEPVLVEAATLSVGRPERARRVLVFTDGRVGDDPAAVVAAVRRLQDLDCGLTLVVDDERGRAALAGLLAETSAEVVLVTDAARLGGALRRAAARARASVSVLHDVALRAGAGLGEVPRLEFPPVAAGVLRRWPASDAAVIVETASSEPVAALRRHGLGRVAALVLASDFGGQDWRAGATGRAWLTGLRGAVERDTSGELALERDGDQLLVRSRGDVQPTTIEVLLSDGVWSAPLRPAGNGLLVAPLPAEGEAQSVTILDAERRRIQAVGLDRLAAPEYRAPPVVDLAALRALAAGPRRGAGAPLRPWLAALSAMLLVAAHWIMARQQSSRPERLPMKE